MEIDSGHQVIGDAGLEHCTRSVLRWDHADLNVYYNLTLQMFEPIYRDVIEIEKNVGYLSLHSKLFCGSDSNVIEGIYKEITNRLYIASQYTIPVVKVGFFKFWWDEEAELLKTESINSHRIWIEDGKPKFGPIYDDKTRCKLNYKLFIKNKKEIETSQISNSLHDALSSKDNKAFWKIWKNKFKGKDKNSCSIDSSNDEKSIAKQFAKSFCDNLNSK